MSKIEAKEYAQQAYQRKPYIQPLAPLTHVDDLPQVTTPEMHVLLETVDHPQHYGGDTPYEAIKVIEAWNLGFALGNCVKYISRAGKKDPAKELEDLNKALWYLTRRIQQVEGE